MQQTFFINLLKSQKESQTDIWSQNKEHPLQNRLLFRAQNTSQNRSAARVRFEGALARRAPGET